MRASARFAVKTWSHAAQVFTRRKAVALDASHLPPATRSGRNRTGARAVGADTLGDDSVGKTLRWALLGQPPSAHETQHITVLTRPAR